jgi:hypothetical protein
MGGSGMLMRRFHMGIWFLGLTPQALGVRPLRGLDVQEL